MLTAYKLVSLVGDKRKSFVTPDQEWALEYSTEEWTESGVGPILCFDRDIRSSWGVWGWAKKIRKGWKEEYGNIAWELWIVEIEEPVTVDWVLVMDLYDEKRFTERMEILWSDELFKKTAFNTYHNAGNWTGPLGYWQFGEPPDGTIGAKRIRLLERVQKPVRSYT